MNTVAFYDTKPYDRQYIERADGAGRLRWQFHEFRLTSETAASVNGAQTVCVFVNDRLDAPGNRSRVRWDGSSFRANMPRFPSGGRRRGSRVASRASSCGPPTVKW